MLLSFHSEEWDYLKRILRSRTSEASHRDVVEEKENETNEEIQMTEQQKIFVDLVSTTSRRLLSYMDISTDDSHTHRLYDAEVIELTNQVSLIVIVPPADMACTAPGTRETLVQRSDLLVIPIQVFEMVHLSSYQKTMLNLYSRLSCILELDTAQAQHNHREAFSSTELTVAKDKLSKLQDLQCQVNTIWKGARWLIDVITFARDRGSSGVSMKNLLSIDSRGNGANTNSVNITSNATTTAISLGNSCASNNNGHSLKRSLLQIPPRDPKLVKSSPGRGSWPGPNLSNVTVCSANLLTNELSKSEQQLPNGRGVSGHYIRKIKNLAPIFSSTTSESKESIDGSGNLNVLMKDSEANGRLPLSRSEDSLLITKYKHSPRNRSIASLASATANAANIPGASSMNIKSVSYGRSFINISGNTTTDSMQSLNSSDDYSVGSSGHGKSKSSKPTASVAAVATPSTDSQLLDSKKDEATTMPAPLPGILQVIIYFFYVETSLAGLLCGKCTQEALRSF